MYRGVHKCTEGVAKNWTVGHCASKMCHCILVLNFAECGAIFTAVSPSDLAVNYLRQGGYVFVVVCLSVYLSVYLFVSNFAQKLPNRFAWNLQGRLAMGQWTNV